MPINWKIAPVAPICLISMMDRRDVSGNSVFCYWGILSNNHYLQLNIPIITEVLVGVIIVFGIAFEWGSGWLLEAIDISVTLLLLLN